ncbi:coiled-coil domain-containing protein 173-like isoform X2 [Xyrichtys novacula]|uniref:Coiled-coil domain-containing protein 173-like isoform X2 n=1 Tax=Xyrichtys novacula TaxID=13765 RepID=A0AAV1GLL9_XYRNO|nr:coiled-coil domain-containing protein 173-like isoform X2 [Xyrichtys novacula]
MSQIAWVQELIREWEATLDTQIAEEKEKKKHETLDKERDCVRRFHSQLDAINIRKENKELSKLRQERQKIATKEERQFEEKMVLDDKQVLREQQEQSLRRKELWRRVGEENEEMGKEKRLLREKKKIQAEKEERAELRALDELYAQEQKDQAEKEAQLKAANRKRRLNDIAEKNFYKQQREQQSILKDRKIERDRSETEEQCWQRKEYIDPRFVQRQFCMDKVRCMLEKEGKKKEESRARDEEKVCEEAKKQAAVEQIQKQIQGEKRDQMLQAVSAHKEAQMRKKVQKQLEEKQRDLELIEAQKEDNRLYFERESQKAKSARARNIKVSDGNVKLRAQRRAIQEQQRKEAKEAEKRQAKALAAEEKEFKEYAERELQKARASGRIVLNTNKAPSRLENKCKDDRPQSFLPPINSSPPPAYIHCESAGAKCREALPPVLPPVDSSEPPFRHIDRPAVAGKGEPLLRYRRQPVLPPVDSSEPPFRHMDGPTAADTEEPFLLRGRANPVLPPIISSEPPFRHIDRPAVAGKGEPLLRYRRQPVLPPVDSSSPPFRHVVGPTAANTREPLPRYSTRETRRIRRKQDSCALPEDVSISSAPYRGGFTKYDAPKTCIIRKMQLAKDLKPSPPPQPKNKSIQTKEVHPSTMNITIG